MSPKPTIEHVYNLKKLSEKVKISNSYQKLQMVYKGINFFGSKEEIKATIDTLEAEHKKTIKLLKSMIK